MHFSIFTPFAIATIFCFLSSCSLLTENECLCHEKIKYAEYFAEEHDLNCYFDYDQALYCARTLKKPLLILIGGWNHLQFSQMKESTLKSSKLRNYWEEHFVTVILYLDDKRELAEEDKYWRPNRKLVKNIGNYNAYITMDKYRNSEGNGMYLVDFEENILDYSYPYRLEVDSLIQWSKTTKHKFDNPTPISQ